MKKIFTKIFTIVLTLVGLQSFAQTTLAPGDIAFIAYAVDAPDRFAFINFVDLAPGTTISFTDNKWRSVDSLGTTEQILVWTSPANVLSAGTVVTVMTDTLTPSNAHNLAICNFGTASDELDNLGSNGEQILAFQGASISPSFIAGISSKGWESVCDQANTGNTDRSCLPLALTNGVNAVSFPTEVDNGFYDCVNFASTGTPGQMLASINDSTHWVRSNTNQTWPTCSIVLGNKSVKESVPFKAFPNPSSTGVFNLTKNVSLQVYNMVGVNVMNAVNTNTVDISGLSAGVYIVRTNNNEMIKIVKSN